MKKIGILIVFISMFSSCSESEPKKEGWTEKEEIHFYTDCKGNMMERGEEEEIAKVFCTCCLKELQRRYKTGKEAMASLTDEEVKEIELGCVEK